MIPVQVWNHFGQSGWKKWREGGDGCTSGVFLGVQESEQFRMSPAWVGRGSLPGLRVGKRAGEKKAASPPRLPPGLPPAE